jgi:dienelactone hydrolase
MLKRTVFYTGVFLLFIAFFRSFWGSKNVLEDFSVRCAGLKYDILVEKPPLETPVYPLLIYYPGNDQEDTDHIKKRELAKSISDEGYLVWIPTRKSINTDYPEEVFDNSINLADILLDTAVNSADIDNKDINVLGCIMGANTAFLGYIDSPFINKMILCRLGAPMDDMFLFQHTSNKLNNAVIDDTNVKVLIISYAGDGIVDLGSTERIRGRLLKKGILCYSLQYEDETDRQAYCTGRSFLDDVISFLKGKRHFSQDKIRINDRVLEKWDRLRRTGYW